MKIRMKILYITTIGGTMMLFQELINNLILEGHVVDIATNGELSKVPECFYEWGCKIYALPCSRSPFAKGNLLAIKQIKKIVNDNHYDIVHCHTPVASVCTRLACKDIRKHGIKVIYTAHGFHFYKGAPLKNWLLYYPLEWICAYFTDVLITINHEDYQLAKCRLKAKQVEYMPGVGINLDKFKYTVIDKEAKRRELGIPNDAFLLVSVGELNSNKNHEVIIRAVHEIKNKNIYYIIAGVGPLEKYLSSLIHELDLEQRVYLLGFRYDVVEIYKAADVCCFPSIREGLGLAAIEGIASGLPVIATDNRGTREFIQNGVNGFVTKYENINDFGDLIQQLYQDPKLVKRMSGSGEACIKKYDIALVNYSMKKIYQIN